MQRRDSSIILFVDLPSRWVTLADNARKLMRHRLELEARIVRWRRGAPILRPLQSYSRGMLGVASEVRRHGFDVAYVVYSDPNDAARLPSLIAQSQTICVTAMTPTIGAVADICQMAKSIKPTIRSIVGGPHVRAVGPRVLFDHPVFDTAIATWNTDVLLRFLADINTRTPESGVYVRKGEKILGCDQIADTSDNHIPEPSYGLLYYKPAHYAHNVRTQYGCIMGCDYCAESSYPSLTPRPAEEVVGELKFLATYCPGQTLVHISDPVFNADPDRTIALCRLMRAVPKLQFSVDIRADLVVREVLEEMIAARITYIRIGIENADEDVLALCNRSNSFRSAMKTAGEIRRIADNVVIHGYWLTGMPGTTTQTLKRNAATIHGVVRERLVDVISNKIVVPYPETSYFQNPAAYKMTIQTQDWRRYDRQLPPVYNLGNLTSAEIYEGYLMQEESLVESYAAIAPLEIGNLKPYDYKYINYVKRGGR